MGDGKTSPFGAGNGKGAAASAGVFDPAKGTGPAAGKAAPFDLNGQKNPQRGMEQERGVELGPASGEPSGGMTPFADIARPNAVNPSRRAEQGVGSIGDSRMPFRLNGGSK